jgi:cytochrome c oxidase subunit 2
VIVEGLLLYATIRYRQRSDRDTPVQVHGNRVMEIAWTIAPALILVVLAVPTLGTIFSLAATPTGPDVVHVTVKGHQWWWEYDYTDSATNFITANEMHIPLNRKVELKLESVDVIHSFWIPALAGKTDVIPGRVNHMYIEADRAGTYLGQCAEYCGLSHANMRLRVIAMNDADYASWIADQKQDANIHPTDPLSAQGAAIFSKTCIACHNIRGFPTGVGKLGPDLTHVADRTTFAGATFDLTAANLISWVSDAPSMKPGSDMPSGLKTLGLTPAEVQALVAFLETLH